MENVRSSEHLSDNQSHGWFGYATDGVMLQITLQSKMTSCLFVYMFYLDPQDRLLDPEKSSKDGFPDTPGPLFGGNALNSGGETIVNNSNLPCKI